MFIKIIYVLIILSFNKVPNILLQVDGDKAPEEVDNDLQIMLESELDATLNQI